VRNDSEHGWEQDTVSKKDNGGNGILVAAIIFCVFLLGMASVISSYDVPEELVGVRKTLYTILVL